MSGAESGSAESGGAAAGGAVEDVLAELRDWPVNNVAAAALWDGGSGARTATFGDTAAQFPLASVSKLITAYATLLAVEEGAFELDHQVPAELLPDFDDLPTVRELLAHTSGIGFRDRTPEKPRGTRRIYSSAGYEVLADFIAAEADMPFADYVAEGVCAPLGIEVAVEGSAGHGFSASVDALSVLCSEFLTPSLLAPSTLNEALEPQWPELSGVVPGYGMQKPCPWGLGFELHGEKSPHWLGEGMPTTVAGHFGQSGTFLWVDRSGDKKKAAVVLTDENFGDWAKQRWDGFNQRLWEALG